MLTIPAFYANSGRLLASAGHILAIPHFPSENIETRASDARYVLSFLESENANTNSLFFLKIDPRRLGIIGHSLGGLTALMVAARDSRIRVAIALDAVNPPPFMGLGSWAYISQAPGITAPVAILGAPAQTCNYDAQYSSMYPYIGSEHKALVVFANGNHCDFQSRRECYLVCPSGGNYDAERVRQIDRDLVAWLEYYFSLRRQVKRRLDGPARSAARAAELGIGVLVTGVIPLAVGRDHPQPAVRSLRHVRLFPKPSTSAWNHSALSGRPRIRPSA